MTLLTSRRARAAVACAAGLTAAITTTGIAHADNELPVEYDAVGSSTIAKTGGTVPLGPTVLSTLLDPNTGAFTGHLPLPSTRTSFKAVGLLPTTATVGFTEAAPVTGALVTAQNGSTSVRSTASYYITLRDIKVVGLPLIVGPKCRTSAPVVIPANTPAGGTFGIEEGGHLTGSFTIGKFANCGLATGLLNLLIPGAGNTVDITVSNGRIPG